MRRKRLGLARPLAVRYGFASRYLFVGAGGFAGPVTAERGIAVLARGFFVVFVALEQRKVCRKVRMIHESIDISDSGEVQHGYIQTESARLKQGDQVAVTLSDEFMCMVCRRPYVNMGKIVRAGKQSEVEMRPRNLSRGGGCYQKFDREMAENLRCQYAKHCDRIEEGKVSKTIRTTRKKPCRKGDN